MVEENIAVFVPVHSVGLLSKMKRPGTHFSVVPGLLGCFHCFSRCLGFRLFVVEPPYYPDWSSISTEDDET